MSIVGSNLILKLLYLVFFIHLVASEYLGTQIQEYLAKNPKLEPWMGFLMFRDIHGVHRMAIVILIAPYFALGYASQIALIDRKYLADSTIAVFPGKIRGLGSTQWELFVKAFLVHPEFNVHTINSVGILQLYSTEEDVPVSFWAPVNWPRGYHKYHRYQSLIMIGFVEKNTTIEQIHRRMDDINKYACKEFYIEEQMDYKYTWPTNYICFTETHSNRSCVYDQGMAVFDNSSSKMTLLGISTTGPGCKLPSRFIELFPYISWIQESISHLMPTRKSKFVRIDKEIPTRRNLGENPTFRALNSDFFDNKTWDWDGEVTGMAWNNTVTFKRVDKPTQTWDKGDCNTSALKMVYQETGYFQNSYLNLSNNTAHYVFSLYDTKHDEVTCIKAKLYTPGIGTDTAKVYKTDSFHQLPIQYYIKYKPKISLRDWLQGGRFLVMRDYYKLYYRKPDRKIISFELNFMFRNRAEIHVIYYTAVPEVGTTVPPPTTTTKRTYTTQRHKKYKGIYVYKKLYDGWLWPIG